MVISVINQFPVSTEAAAAFAFARKFFFFIAFGGLGFLLAPRRTTVPVGILIVTSIHFWPTCTDFTLPPLITARSFAMSFLL